jgi:hypothetical protein
VKTHPESVWVDHFGLDESRNDGSSITEVMSEESEACEGDVEFVPAAAYIELKAKLETAEYSANGFESLYDAAYKEIAELKTQLANAWSSGYVAGQEVAKDGEPKRNPFANIFATDEVSR